MVSFSFGDGSSFNILPASKIVGNYSEDVLRYKCKFDEEKGDYKFTNRLNKQIITKPPEWSYNCSKFSYI